MSNKSDTNLRRVVESEDQIELIDTLELTESMKEDVILPYLRDLYKDLLQRSDAAEKGIPRVVLLDFFNLPGLIGERLFTLFDADKDGYSRKEEFMAGSLRLLSQSFETNSKLVFDLYDFDKDKLISSEDIRTLLSYVPLSQISSAGKSEGSKEGLFTQGGGGFDFYRDRVESQEELQKLLLLCMKGRDKIKLEEFVQITEKVSSELFLCIFLLVRKQVPFFQQILLYGRKIKKQGSKGGHSPTTTKVLSSPKLLTRFGPVSSMVKGFSPEGKRAVAVEGVGPKTNPALMKYTGIAEEDKSAGKVNVVHGHGLPKEGEKELVKKIRPLPPSAMPCPKPGKVPSKVPGTVPSTVPSKKGVEDEGLNTDVIRLPNVTKLGTSPSQKRKEPSVDLLKSPSLFLREPSKGSPKRANYCECGTPCEGDNKQCNSCLHAKDVTEYSGYLLKKDKTNKLKKMWYTLLNKELYSYGNAKEEKYKRMRSLAGAFIKEELEEIIDKKVLHSFTLCYLHKKLTFYAANKEEKTEWIKSFKQALGYANFYDFYELKDTLGQGKFGVVKLGVHKKTQKQVAVKILKKGDMSSEDTELVKREIEVLKLCQHPNIIRLLDLFENHDYIYIIMELLQGGDLFTYLEKKGFQISEARAATIIHSLATAVSYLHSYGIAHRDLKPENVLMTDESDSSVPKIVDFGLAKMVGPNEKCLEPFGTLSYVAPEVLMQQPYDKSVDVWSLGVVAYLLLCGTLPYDDEDEKEIIRQTIYDPPDFAHKGWRKVPQEAIDFVGKILVKEKSKRMTLSQILEHPWISRAKAEASPQSKGASSAAKAEVSEGKK